MLLIFLLSKSGRRTCHLSRRERQPGREKGQNERRNHNSDRAYRRNGI